MNRLGINLSTIHFHKGYGLDHEADSIEEATQWAQKLHANGIFVGVYIGCTFFPETFEHPQYDDMIMQHDCRGWNESQYFRDFWCYNSPIAIEYFKNILGVAIESLKADLIHFDSAFCCYHDQLCHCKYCLAAFEKYLRNNIPDIVKAAGYTDPTHLKPPPCSNGNALTGISKSKEPGDIAWSLFHAEAGFDAVKSLCTYARELKNDISIFYNGANLSGITPFSRPHREMETLELADATAVEDDNENWLHVTPDGMPVSRFRSYKAGFRSKTRVLYYTSIAGRNNQLMLAEAAAFAYRTLGFVETAMQKNHCISDSQDLGLLDYLTTNEDLFLNRRPWHNIAVIRHHESMLLNPFPSGLTPYVVEQMLFEGQQPFAIISASELARKDLREEFAVLILPDCRSLSDEQIVHLETYVSHGGKLLALGDVATATSLNQHRRHWGLRKIFNAEYCPNQNHIDYQETADSVDSKSCEPAHTQDQLDATYGKGRAMHLPPLDFDLPPKTDLTRFGGFDWYYHPYWKPPHNAPMFVRALEELMGQDWRIKTDLPRHVGLECYQIKSGWRICLVNYANPELVAPAALAINLRSQPCNNVTIDWRRPNETKSLDASINSEKVLSLDLPKFNLMATITITTGDDEM